MASSLMDSTVFRDLFGTPAMRRVFSDEGQLERYLEVEAALARVQSELGMIPAEAGEEIGRQARLEHINLKELKAGTERAGRPVLPLVRALAAACRKGAGAYVHWGASTPDIMDTGTVLQIRDGLALVEQDLLALEDVLSGLARAHRDTLMVGRTNGQHAMPITFGYKVAIWLWELHRHRLRLKEARPRVLIGQFGGAVGTLPSYGDRGLELRAALMAELGLAEPVIAWHVARDGIAEVVWLLGLITSTLGRIGTEVLLLSRPEVAELAEPFEAGRGASSSMPQKRNPRHSEVIVGIAKILRQHSALALDSMAQEHERTGGAWIVQWAALPEAFVLASGALHQALALLRGLVVDRARMRANIAVTRGSTAAEAVMMALAGPLGQPRAHGVVYAACRLAEEQRRPLREVMLSLPEVSEHLSEDELAVLTDPDGRVGLAGYFVDDVVRRVTLSRN